MTERIHRLPRPTSTRLRSTLIIPSLPVVLNELAQNSLDAGARRVDAWVSLTRGSEGVRVEDDGCGISVGDMERVGAAHMTSKRTSAAEMSGVQGYGFRGEAIAAIAALALVEVTSRVDGNDSASKIIKNGEVIFSGKARELGRAHGTTVAVRDLFNGIPVRQAALASATGTLAACKRVIEVLALIHPRVMWTLWEDRPTGPRKVLALHGASTPLDMFRAVYGTAGVEKVQKVHVSSGNRRVDGFISLEGSVTKAHQHIYVNGYPLDMCELHHVVARRFAKSQFSSLASDLTDDIRHRTLNRPSPRRLERHPVYVLDITLPPEDVDTAYEPRKSTLGYRDPTKVQSFLVAVVDDFLRRQGFASRAATVSPTPSPRKRVAAGSPLRPPAKVQRLFARRGRAASVDAEAATPDSAESSSEPPGDTTAEPVDVPASATADEQTVTSSRPTAPKPLHEEPNWIEDILQKIDNGVLPIRSGPARSALDAANPTELTAELPGAMNDITFPIASFASAKVLRQVNRMFVAGVLQADSGQRVLVLFDQHAADERASVEGILDALCEGFARDNMPTTELPEDTVRLVLTRSEGEALALPGARDVLRRWGLEFGDVDGQGDYIQLSVRRFPSLLDRLGRKQGTEMTRLLKLYLPVLVEHMGEIRALLESLEASEGWARVQRWMPREMLELANSKACRGAIMFEDKLDTDQCARLLARLAATRNPWMCAHGRPTFAPLRVLNSGRAAHKRVIDWRAWKTRNEA